MEIRVEGLRATDHSRSIAYHASASELPELTAQEKSRASASGWTDERYARSKYARELGAQEWAERVKTVAVLINKLLAERAQGLQLLTITLQTLQGVYRIAAESPEEGFAFQVREDIIDDLLEGGDASALERLRRIIEMATLPYVRQDSVV